MTRRRWKHTVPVLFLFVLCGPWSPLIQASPFQSQSINEQGVNLAVFIQGEVSVKRKGWTAYEPVVFGTNLRPGDLLRVEVSSTAKVVCSDLTLRAIEAGTVGVPCVASRPVLWRPDGSMINATRSWPNDGSFPVVLSPRKTKLLSPQPILRWTPVEGATVYQVIVRGMNAYWAGQVASATETVYPARAPRLEAGVDYKLIVEANGRNSSAEPGLGLGFSILGSDERKTVLKRQKQIEDLGLQEGPTQFLVAHLYANYGLRAEAIERLEAISKTFKAAAVARLLGELYLDVGLTRQSEARYLSSLERSKDEKDEEGQMLAHLALANIYQALGNSKSESEHLDATLVLANKIGDDQTASQAEKRLAQLKRAGV